MTEAANGEPLTVRVIDRVVPASPEFLAMLAADRGDEGAA